MDQGFGGTTYISLNILFTDPGLIGNTFIGFLGSWFLVFLVSWFLSFLVYWFLGFLVSWFLGLEVFWFLGFLVSEFLGFTISWFLGFKVSKIHKVISCTLIDSDHLFKIFERPFHNVVFKILQKIEDGSS